VIDGYHSFLRLLLRFWKVAVVLAVFQIAWYVFGGHG